MNTFKSFFAFEFKRFIGWRNSFVLGLFLLLSIGLVHMGVQQYRNMLDTKKEFQEIEKEKVGTFIRYQQYGGYGIRLLFLPSPLNVLFHNSSKFSDLTAHIDVGGKLNIYNSFKGKDIFSERQGKFLDFSGAFLLLGSLIALFYGYEFLRHLEYHKFVTSLLGRTRSFFCHIISKIILLSLYFILVTGCAVILLMIELDEFPGINPGYILGFAAVILLVFLFFFLMGTISAFTGSKFARFFIIAAWVGFVYFAPAALNNIVKVSADRLTSNYKFELNKLDALMNFEKRVGREFAKEKAKPGITEDELKTWIRENTKSYLKKEFKDIQEHDEKAKEEMEPLTKNYQTLAAFFPSTFYLTVCNEIGSSGYRNLINFYDKIRETRKKFVEFYVDKQAEEFIRNVFDGKQSQEKVESFIKGDENIIEGQSMLPVNFYWGIFITILWVALLVIASYFLYKRALISLPKIKGETMQADDKEITININRRESHSIICLDKMLNQHLFNIFSGLNKEFKGKVSFGGIDMVGKQERTDNLEITDKRETVDFVYLCHPEHVPWAIKAKDFVTFIVRALELPKEKLKTLQDDEKLSLEKAGKKYFSDLAVSDKGRILFECALLKECGIYMIDDFARGMPANFIKDIIDRLEELKRKNVAIIYFTNDVITAQKIGDYMTLLKKDKEILGVNL